MKAFIQQHIEKIAYGTEGVITGLLTHYAWGDILLSILVSALCAAITLLIQYYGKRLLNSFHNRRLPKFRQNGKQ